MGLFDRFKKKAEEAAEEEDFTVEEDSIEAEEALLQRRQLMEAIERAKNAQPPPPPPGFEQFKEEKRIADELTKKLYNKYRKYPVQSFSIAALSCEGFSYNIHAH